MTERPDEGVAEIPAGRGVAEVPIEGELAKVEAEVEEDLAALDVDAPLVAIVMGSESDRETMAKAEAELEERGIFYEVRVMSAHREPDVVSEYAKELKFRGFRVVIAGAGLSAALPGVMAAHTELPVIGVPLTSASSALGGLDALLACTQMPPGVPVGSVGLNAARNAAVLAARIIES
ncbi:MAG: 5-(carboxyamino)imidazole ribonucleotide mutase [Solirubrobacteraceae bacterium]